MLDGESGQVSVGHEVPRGASRAEQIAQDPGMSARGVDDGRDGMGKPPIDVVECGLGERTTRALVVSRTNPSRTVQASPTVSLPDSVAFHQRTADRCSGAV